MGCVMCQNAARAYNIMASANGSETINNEYSSPGSSLSSYFGLTELDNNRGGIKGMNINMVKNFILPTFSNKISNLYVSIENIPTSSALYDIEGSQAGAFSTSSLNYKIKIESLVSEIVAKINEYLITETNNLMLAQQQSTDAMNMNA